MDFAYTQDQQAFADSARALFADYCSDDALRAHDSGSEPFMRALWAQCTATGMHAVLVGEDHGGLGQGATELAAVLEEQGRALALVPLAEHQLAAAAIERHAPQAAGAIVRAAVAGEMLLTLSLDAVPSALGAQIATRRDGAAFVLDGRAHAVPLAAQSDAALLPVRLDDGPRLVLLRRDTPGVSYVEGRSQRHLGVADVVLEGVRLDAAALLAEGALAWLEPRLVAALAAQQVGVSAGQLVRTVEYISQRRQFGRAIGTFQLVAGQMADAKIALEALRSALAQLVYRLDAGLGCTPQAHAVKVLAARAAHLVGHKAQHVHGGMGVDVTYPIHRYLYWSRALANTLGGEAPALERLGDWLAGNDCLGWKYDLPEDRGAAHAQ